MSFLKFNVILGKKQIILASLVMILSIAVYLNYTFSGANEYDLIAKGNETVSDEVHYGEAQLTGAPVRMNTLPPQGSTEKKPVTKPSRRLQPHCSPQNFPMKKES